ncbi:MerC domain-containing protein [Polaribacter sp. Q13]|uniref:MerC domain-containing protein n=1 Tax=Polaribacter sp. Q13 TaxID=2806551 RepID=UPI00193B9578|nr:MerC domain-containing protein [Polaribacter sp. Q13]QVY65211.1 MerC domain-containing protein [Polaribacter sp. Q13]
MTFTNQKADHIGAIASSLCLIHCVATPFIFIAQSSVLACCSTTTAPSWWKFIDYFFLVISFLAIYRSTETTANNWMKPSLWFSWLLLFVVIINEKIALLSIPESAIYIPAIALIILHTYNRKYCQCKTDKCCSHEK